MTFTVVSRDALLIFCLKVLSDNLLSCRSDDKLFCTAGRSTDSKTAVQLRCLHAW